MIRSQLRYAFSGCREGTFVLGKSLESLPPTTDANYQTKVWLQTDSCHMSLRTPAESGGWKEPQDQETISARELSGTSPANVTVANAAHWPASAFSLVKFVYQRVDVQQTAA